MTKSIKIARGSIALFLLGFSSLSYTAYAQDIASPPNAGTQEMGMTPRHIMACDRYEQSVDMYYKGKEENIFNSLRPMYARCPYYDPYGEKTLRLLIDLHEKAGSADPKESLASIKEYKELARKHLANLEVMNYAFQESKKDPRFGNQDFFKKILKMIKKSIKSNGADGTEPSKAIPIITMAEQRYVLSQVEGKIEKNEIVDSKGRAYSIYDFIDNRGLRRFSIFFDLTIPMNSMRAAQEETEKREKLNLGVK